MTTSKVSKIPARVLRYISVTGAGTIKYKHRIRQSLTCNAYTPSRLLDWIISNPIGWYSPADWYGGEGYAGVRDYHRLFEIAMHSRQVVILEQMFDMNKYYNLQMVRDYCDYSGDLQHDINQHLFQNPNCPIYLKYLLALES